MFNRVGFKTVGVLLFLIGLAWQVQGQQSSIYDEGNSIIEEVEKPKIKVEKVAECGFDRAIRVATTVNNRPFGWVERFRGYIGGALIGKGFGIDMFEEIARKLNLSYQVTGYADDKDAILALKKGDVDLLIGIYTPETTIGGNVVAVYPAIFSNIFAVYYKKDQPFEVIDSGSLAGKRGVVRRSENIYPLFSTRLPASTTLSVETTENAFKKILSEEADFLIGSPYSVEAELRRYKLHNEIIAAPQAISQAAMYMVLTRVGDCYKLGELLGQAIDEYTADPARVDQKIRHIIDEWGERFRDSPRLELKPDENKEEEDQTKNS